MAAWTTPLSASVRTADACGLECAHKAGRVGDYPRLGWSKIQQRPVPVTGASGAVWPGGAVLSKKIELPGYGKAKGEIRWTPLSSTCWKTSIKRLI
jgi:hypothetical protein